MVLNCGITKDSWESLGQQGYSPTILKEINWIFIGRTDAEAEALILWPPNAKSQLIGKDPDAGQDWRWEEKRTTEDEMVGWHHWLNGHEFEQTLGNVERRGSLACCSPWGSQRARHHWTTIMYRDSVSLKNNLNGRLI